MSTDDVLSRYSQLCIEARRAAHVPNPAAAERDAELFLILKGIHARLDDLEAQRGRR